MAPVKSVLITSSDKAAAKKVENSLDDSFRSDLASSFDDGMKTY